MNDGRVAPEHTQPSPSAPRGAYGFAITGVDAPSMMLATAPHWPRLRVLTRLGEPAVTAEVLTGDRIELILKTGGRLLVDRTESVASFTVPRHLSDDELVHPYLAPAAAVMAYWHGRLSFHAGAFLTGDGVWGVVGGREAGKSSALAWLSLHDHGIVTDDILVLDAATAYAGPRSIDLRRETAEHLGVGAGLGFVGTRERWRITLPQIACELPFRGWIFLSWSATANADMRRLPSSECMERLIDNLGLRLPLADPARLLQLATLPAWEFSRPRDWDSLTDSMQRMLSVLLH